MGLDHSLVDGVLAGHPRSVARAITLVESGGKEAKELLKELRSRAGRAHTVGVTGSPGAGKSTLINQLIKEFRGRSRSVGVIAIDPTSPFTGGAILGDRVRMQELARDPQVFVRSMGTRGRLGGLGRATEDAVAVLDAAGKDLVIVETVGVGQDEVDIAGAAQTTAVVMVPVMGDGIQAMKAGLLEVADVFVVNKADLDGADRMAAELETISALNDRDWQPPVLETVATSGLGIALLADALDSHRTHLSSLRQATEPKAHMIRKRLLAIAGSDLLEMLETQVGERRLRHVVDLVAAGERDVYSAAEDLVESFLQRNRAERPGETIGERE